MNIDGDLYVVKLTAPYATFGISIDPATGKVNSAAPIGKWMVGEPLAKIESWITEHRGTIKKVKI